MAQRQLILDKTRNLGDVISDGFTLVKRNFKVVGSLFLMLVFPILLVSMYNLYFVFSEMDFLNMENSSPFAMFGGIKIIIGYSFMMLAFMIYYFIIFSSAITFQKNNNQTPDSRMVIEFMKENAVKYATYFLGILGLIIVMSLIFFFIVTISPLLSVFVSLAFLIGMVYLFPIMNILPIVYLDSELNFIDSVKETFRLIRGEWWATFGVLFITNIIGSFASYILIIPVYAIMMVQVMGSIDSTSGDPSGMMSFWMSILIVVSVISSTIVLIYTASSVVLKYYDLRESKDNVSLFDKIDSIGSGESSMFENEGEY